VAGTGETDTVSPLCFHFIHFLQRTHYELLSLSRSLLKTNIKGTVEF
jgi:hypothetical protein